MVKLKRVEEPNRRVEEAALAVPGSLKLRSFQQPMEELKRQQQSAQDLSPLQVQHDNHNDHHLHHHDRHRGGSVAPSYPVAVPVVGSDIALTLLHHVLHARTDGQRLHLLRQLRNLLVFQDGRFERHDGMCSSCNGRDEVEQSLADERLNDTVYHAFRAQALDNSVDLKLAWLLTMELRQEQGSAKAESPCTREAVFIITDCLAALWEHDVATRRRLEQSHARHRQRRGQKASSSPAWAQHFIPFAPWLVLAARTLSNPHQQEHGNMDNVDNEDRTSESVFRIFRVWIVMSSKMNALNLVGNLVRTPGLIELLRELLMPSQPPPSECHSPLLPQLILLIKDLAYRSSDVENQLLCFNLLAELLAILPVYLDSQSNQKSWDTAGRILAVLWKFSTVTAAAWFMAENDVCWKALRLAASVPLCSDSAVVAVHRHTASIAGCLVAATVRSPSSNPSGRNESATAEILQAQSEWLVSYVFHVLKSCAGAGRDQDLRRRCVRLLRCFASHPRGRSILLMRRRSTEAQSCTAADDVNNEEEDDERLLPLLVHVLSSPKESVDVRSQACQTVTLLLEALVDDGVSDSEDCKFAPCLEAIVIRTIQDDRTPAKLVAPLCEALHSSIVHNGAWSRGSTNCSSGFYERLLSILQENISQSALHDKVSSLVLRLLLAQSMPQLAREQQSCGVLHLLADLAALLLSSVGPEFETSRKNGIAIVERLVKLPNADGDFSSSSRCRKALADNERLLSALVGYCLMLHTNGPQRDRVKQLILQLVPEL